MLRDSLKRLLRAYATLNLRMAVLDNMGEANIVLPGLRYDDVTFSGQPDIWRLFDMVNRVEHAAMHADYSYLDYQALSAMGLGVLSKAVQLHIRPNFYEHTTPKAPLDLRLRLVHIGNSTFTSAVDVCVGGRSQPSVRVMTLFSLLHLDTLEPQPIPDWWRSKFEKAIPDIQRERLFTVEPSMKPPSCFSHGVTVPMMDTDTHGRTRCASYMRYFLDNASIASVKDFYPTIGPYFHLLYPKRMSLMYYRPSSWGDVLTVESWEETTSEGRPLLNCQVSRGKDAVWSSQMAFHGPIIGLPHPPTQNIT